MGDDNKLIDAGAKTKLSDYAVITPGQDGGVDFHNPLMPGPGATKQNPHWLSGIPILDNEQSFLSDLKQNQKFTAIFDAAGAVMDEIGVGLQAAEDISTGNIGGVVGNMIAAPLTAWILDHVKPIRLVMDELLGNPGTVAGISATWTNMSQALAGATNDLQKAVADTQGYWQGEAADTYRNQHAAKLSECLGTAAMLCEAWGLLLDIMSDCVKIVHDTVRDLIAAMVAMLTEIAVNAMCGGPEYALAELATEGPVDVIRVATIVGKLVTKLLEGAFEGCSVAAKILTAITELAKVAKDLVQLGTQKSVPTHS